MGTDNSGNKTIRLGFSRKFPVGSGVSSSSLVSSSPVKFVYPVIRDFPPGCGPNAARTTKMCPEKEFRSGSGVSSSSLISSRVKSVYPVIRDFPPGCGPNAARTTIMCPEKELGREKISGAWTDASTRRRLVGASKIKPPLSGKKVVENPQKLKGKEPVGFCSVSAPPLGDRMVAKKPQNLKGKEPVGLDLDDVVKNKLPLSDTLVKEAKIPKEVKGNEPVRSGEREKVVEDIQKLKGREPVSAVKEPMRPGEREKVVEMLRLFRRRCDEISRNKKGARRVDTKADMALRREGKIVHQSALMIGSVPGVEVGDKFYYRVELMIVGLHKHLQAGIDFMEFGKKQKKIATCVVAREGHLDKMNDPDSLTYVGVGGNSKPKEVGRPPHQELEGGNLALQNSMKMKKEVRVVRGIKVRVVRGVKFRVQKILYVYDGLYEVKNCTKKKGPEGNMIFEFLLMRCFGQPVIPWEEYKCSR